MTWAPCAAAWRAYSSWALIIDSLSPVQLVWTSAARITSAIVASGWFVGRLLWAGLSVVSSASVPARGSVPGRARAPPRGEP